MLEKNNRIVAVVVTYNRLNLLKECINSLLNQICSCDILIIDNDSTDGTKEWIESCKDKYKNIKYKNTESNLGGAGGFNFGIKLAVEYGYDYLWIMDDDCIAKTDTLYNFICAGNILNNEYGFLSSKVLWKDGSLSKMNKQRKTMYEVNSDFSSHIVPIVMASFVSLFIKSDVIREFGLPIKEFFIWTDDWEYTRRISRNVKSYLVNNSLVVHKSKDNIGADISNSDVSRLERFFYLYRNDVYLYRREGIKGWLYEVFRLSFHMVKVLLNARDNKLKRLLYIFKGTINGMGFKPKIELI